MTTRPLLLAVLSALAGVVSPAPTGSYAADPPKDIKDNEAIIFELQGYQTQSGKFRVRLQIPPGKIYQAFELGDIHPSFKETGSGRTRVRSVALGKNVGVVFRWGDGVYAPDKRNADHTSFLTSQPDLQSPWINDHLLNIIVFRKDIVDHPHGVAFRNHNPFQGSIGPAAGDRESFYILANSPQDANRMLGRITTHWVTLYGKGTKLTVWFDGKPKEFVAASNDPGKNTFYAPSKGIDLSKADDTHSDPIWIKPRIEVTAPKFAVADGEMGLIKPGGLLVKPDTESGIGAAAPKIVGVYRQIGMAAVDVTIGQNSAKPSEFACRIPKMNLIGKGTIDKDGIVSASFGAPNASGTDFGPLGAFTHVKGKIAKVDANNNVLRIEWDNGVVYERK